MKEVTVQVVALGRQWSLRVRSTDGSGRTLVRPVKRLVPPSGVYTEATFTEALGIAAQALLEESERLRRVPARRSRSAPPGGSRGEPTLNLDLRE